MLNLSFSKKINEAQRGYRLPGYLIDKVKAANAGFATGAELRLQKEYGEEIWQKIRRLGLSEADFNQKKILDICCGTGFLSYHILARVKPEELTLLDISADEIAAARKLLGGSFPAIGAKYIVSDATRTDIPGNSFDIIIGNSFIHHFYDVPGVFSEIRRMLKDGGIFISLHEPAPAATAYESGWLKYIMAYLVLGKKMIDLIRYRGDEVSPQAGPDVWMFEEKELAELAQTAGFTQIKTRRYYIARPILFAVGKMHLTPDKRELTKTELFLFRTSLRVDAGLSRMLPARLSGAVCIIMKK